MILLRAISHSVKHTWTLALGLVGQNDHSRGSGLTTYRDGSTARPTQTVARLGFAHGNVHSIGGWLEYQQPRPFSEGCYK